MELVNKNLITLKCVILCFFAGAGCLLPYLPSHMLSVGLTRDEARIISIVAPCIAILGPLIAGPLADKLSVGLGASSNKNKYGSGKILRLMIAACFVLGALFYLLLLAVPTTLRHPARRPMVSFSCDENSGVVFQEVCTEDLTCNRWTGEKEGLLRLTDCQYVCDTTPAEFINSVNEMKQRSTTTESSDYGDEDIENDDPGRERREDDDWGLEPAPPHLCRASLGDSKKHCTVYTEDTKYIDIPLTLLSGADNATEGEWCQFREAKTFDCNVPTNKSKEMIAKFGSDCRPIVKCIALDPYDVTGSVLADAECRKIEGSPSATFWLYLIIRCIADIFPTAALCLVCAACVVATRDTCRARDEVGRQLAAGAIGVAIFPALAGLATRDMTTSQYMLIPFVLFSLFMLIGALILILDNNMPLSPPEWWWHTVTGLLAMPMNAIRKYGIEIVGVSAVLTLLGILWSALDSYLPWLVTDLGGDEVSLGLTLTIPALLSIPVLWWAETIIDFCGHSNVLITAFLFYCVRYVGMSIIEDANWLLLMEAFEVITLTLVWMTAVLYMRHLVARKYLASGQALAVITHFGLGRCIGAIVGGITVEFHTIYQVLALCSLIAAAIYFPVYHFVLAPRCIAPSQSANEGLTNGVNGTASNGAYSPLRVYHNERAKKGQFRY